ncbi:MAG: CBS domain-containing protein [Chloroflexota bacterium]
MQTVRGLLRGKGSQVYSISPEASVYDALKIMAEKGVGALVVLTREGELAGIVSERDYARKVEVLGKTARETSVREIMTERVVCVRPDQTVEECMALMTNKRIRHLPVIEGNALTGIISIGDVVKAIISEQEFMIAQLENYITGVR